MARKSNRYLLRFIFWVQSVISRSITGHERAKCIIKINRNRIKHSPLHITAQPFSLQENLLKLFFSLTMANWLEVKLDLPQAIRLKKAVRAIGQVAFTDGDYPDEWFTAIPNTAHLCFTSRFMVLACGLSHNYFPKILTFLHIPSSIMRRLDCDESCAVTFPLHILLKQLELNTEFSLSLYGDDFIDDGIRYELEDGEYIDSCKLIDFFWFLEN